MSVGIILPHKKSYKLKSLFPMILSSGDTLEKSNVDDYKSLSGDFYLHSGIPNITSSEQHHEIFNFAKETKKPILILDSHVLRCLPDSKNWFRLSWNSFYLDEGIHPFDYKNNRWEYLSSTYNIKLEPWQHRGDFILINLQKSTDGALNRLNFNNLGYKNFILNTINEIRKISSRTILIRPHPLDNEVADFLKLHLTTENIIFSNNSNLYDDFNKSWCMVTYNSTSCVESTLYGLPTIVLDSSALSWNVSGQTINDIERDLFFDRSNWCNQISFMQWHSKELINPYTWNLIKKDII